jgi:uncharacterized protein
MRSRSLRGGSRAPAGGRAFYRRAFLARGRFRVRHERVEVPGRDLASLRIVQLSDPHAGPFLGSGDLADVVDSALALRPDLCVLTGDLVTRVTDEAFRLVDDLARLEARLGKFAVFGNHDYRGRREHEIAARFASDAGFEFLRDACRRFTSGGATVALVGLEDLEEAKGPDAGRARASVRADDVEVVLCHNPMGAPHLARDGCALILCGHTHGHQIDLPLVRRLAPRHPGDRFVLGTTTVIVSRGLGALGAPLRVRSPAEIVCIDLVGAGGGA